MMEQLSSNETILKQMEAYNFDDPINDPIKVTLLFEDDEEDDKLNEIFEKFKEKSRCTNNNLEINDKTQQASVKEVNTTSDTLTNNSHNTIKNSSNNLPKELSVTKGCQNNIQDMNYMENYYNNCQTQDTFPIEDKTQSSYRYCNTYDQETILNENKKYLLNLLDKVSYYLIEISQCYYYTFIQPNERQTRRARETQYFNIKRKLFDYSFYIVDALLLPQQDNWNFIEKYVQRVTSLAYWKSYTPIPETFILHLILELMNWTKQKKKYFSDKSTYQNEIPTPTNNTLNQRKPKVSCHKRRPKDKPTADSICLFSYGPKNKELSITIQPNVLKDVLSPRNNFIKRRKTSHDISHVDSLQQTHKPDTTSLPTDQMNMIIRRQDEDNISSTRNENSDTKNQLSILRPESSGSQMTSSSSLTHTTSNKPKLPNKMCKVCHTLTHKVCLGCGRENYCSNMCQIKDWPSHMTLCRTKQKLNKLINKN